ncbi:MAG: hypothetical protein HYT87_13005 [Nitrospirae bacterium]|nr:hypothetical protein [Nitrospirota bacterium]
MADAFPGRISHEKSAASNVLTHTPYRFLYQTTPRIGGPGWAYGWVSYQNPSGLPGLVRSLERESRRLGNECRFRADEVHSEDFDHPDNKRGGQ